MKVVILCGGKGTRLREETEYRPKPMVEIGGRPILWHIMKNYAHYGFKEFILCLGYKGNMIKEYFLNYQAMNNDFTINLGEENTVIYHGSHQEQDFKVTLAWTGLDNMTGSRVAQIERYIDGDTFMVTYGDGVSNINISQLVDFHQSHTRLATITTVQPQSRFGTLRLDDQGTVSKFLEKPQLKDWISVGYFVFDRSIFDILSTNPDCVLEAEPLETLATESQMMAYRHEGFFVGMDTSREHVTLNELWNINQAPWKVW